LDAARDAARGDPEQDRVAVRRVPAAARHGPEVARQTTLADERQGRAATTIQGRGGMHDHDCLAKSVQYHGLCVGLFILELLEIRNEVYKIIDQMKG
jgi:hypothetical protein